MSKVTKLPRRKPRRGTSEDKGSTADHMQRLEAEMEGLEQKIDDLSSKISESLSKKGTLHSKAEAWMEDAIKVFASFFRIIDIREYLHAEDVDEFGMDVAFEERIQTFFDFLYEKYWRVEVKGIENVPTDGRALMVSNHSGTVPYDAAMIKLSVRREHPDSRDIRFLVEDFVYYFPFLGTFMYRIGGVRACQENALRLLNKDHAVLCFPEGIKGIGKLYSDRYRLQRFGRGGYIRLCMKTKAPIIPIAVVGAEEIHPVMYRVEWFARMLGIPYLPITPTFPLLGPLGLIPLPTKWRITFGKPIPFDEYTPAQIDNPILVNHLSEKVRERIQAMIAEMLKTRISIWS